MYGLIEKCVLSLKKALIKNIYKNIINNASEKNINFCIVILGLGVNILVRLVCCVKKSVKLLHCSLFKRNRLYGLIYADQSEVYAGKFCKLCI